MDVQEMREEGEKRVTHREIQYKHREKAVRETEQGES